LFDTLFLHDTIFIFHDHVALPTGHRNSRVASRVVPAEILNFVLDWIAWYLFGER
jgi:hypothetical protein